ncbi:MAG TPA: TetR/AcrR family transcriptional regulator [Phycisphaerae bacterium]|nr:TetR/AcrR family transcriptional regulator [Phycisphaerae bacterium]
MTDKSTRDRLLDVAMRLFHEQGYAATGVSTILREAGVNSGSLYYFFPSKEALLDGVLDRYMELLWPEVIDPAFAQTSDTIERVFAVLTGYRQMLVITNCTMGCPIGNLALELSDTYPAVREKIKGLFEAWCAAIRKCLDEAGDRLPTYVDRAGLSRFVLTVMEGGLMQARTHRTLEPYDASVAHLRGYVDQLLAEGRTKRPAAETGE